MVGAVYSLLYNHVCVYLCVQIYVQLNRMVELRSRAFPPSGSARTRSHGASAVVGRLSEVRWGHLDGLQGLCKQGGVHIEVEARRREDVRQRAQTGGQEGGGIKEGRREEEGSGACKRGRAQHRGLTSSSSSSNKALNLDSHWSLCVDLKSANTLRSALEMSVGSSTCGTRRVRMLGR